MAPTLTHCVSFAAPRGGRFRLGTARRRNCPHGRPATTQDRGIARTGEEIV